MRPELVQAFMLKNGECFDTVTLQDASVEYPYEIAPSALEGTIISA